jgi:hemolysin activation/secretion protein
MSPTGRASSVHSLSLSEFSGLPSVRFQLNPLCRALALSLSVFLMGGAMAAEQTASAQSAVVDASPSFGIAQVVLSGNPGVLSRKTQDRLLDVLNTARGPQSGLRQVQAAVQKGQQMLDQLFPGNYVLGIPAQTVVDGGQVAVQVSPLLSDVTITGAPGFDEATVRASLPAMLQKGAIYYGKEWPSPQTLTMLNDHPLKATTVQFRIEPDQPLTAEVSVHAPLGRAQTSVTLDSFGNHVIGRGMMTVTHSQGNVGMPNDVLSFYGSTSLDKPFQVSLGALRYVLPDVDALRNHSFGLTHSASQVDTPYLSFGNVAGKGVYNEISYRQTRYLNWGQSLGMNGSKFFADVALAKSQANTQYLSNVLTDYAVTALPVTLGIEGAVTAQSNSPAILKDVGALVRLQTVLNKAGALGLSGLSDYEKARSGAGSSAVLRWLVDGRATVFNQWRTNVLFTGQYTSNKLLPSGQMAIAGDRSSVRGFINSVLMGDSAAALRWELEPLALNQVWGKTTTQPYAFYDAGYKRGGNDQRTLSVSSSGLGLRMSPQDTAGLSLDVFVARKLQGASLDLVPGTTRQVDKTTMWATGTYRF